ncbi:hypothetical protein AMATHDRAFT_51545 [Amanita thiersii Skay4041]|uniref:Uncharacterized protein n=1 Tax=Amanita thiersii Skay4041 TaxID=703135 RepID=A0A2A9ND01_9AGAR|nr:hypothetical protein AMATHDRAFT_51545 [Amanita thiersii Skay4041]
MPSGERDCNLGKPILALQYPTYRVQKKKGTSNKQRKHEATTGAFYISYKLLVPKNSVVFRVLPVLPGYYWQTSMHIALRATHALVEDGIVHLVTPALVTALEHMTVVSYADVVP